MAIIGICGGTGRAHANMLMQQGVRIAAGVDLAPNLAEVCAGYGAEPMGSYRQLPGRTDLDLDLVIVSLPPALHPEVCADLLRSGHNVLVEKPVALRVSAAGDLVAAARESGRFLMVGHVLRFDPGMAAVRDLIRSGRLGEVKMLTARKCWPAYTSWRLGPGGGAVMIKDVHYWDLVPWLTGTNPATVYAAGGDLFHGTGAEDAYHLIMRLESGAVFHLESAWWTPRSSASLFEAIGTEGRAVLDAGGLTVTGRDGSTESVDLDGTDMLALQYRAAAAALAAGGASPCSLWDGLRAVAVGEAVLESLRTGNPIAVKPYLEAVR